MTLEEYFHVINQFKQKEPTMFERTKMFFAQSIERCAEKINSLMNTPTIFTDNKEEEFFEWDDYWSFSMYTGEWVNEQGEKVSSKHTSIVEPHEGTWIEVLEQIIGELEKHYGYNIREQVYYSVNFPMNHEGFRTRGRELNDDVLQQLLLAFPEVYERNKVWDQPANVFGK